MNKLEKHRYFINYEKLINDVNNSQKKLEDCTKTIKLLKPELFIKT